MLEILKRSWWAWKKVGLAVVAAQNWVFVAVVFVFGVGPTALIARLTRRRLLDRDPLPEPPDSHWVPLPEQPPTVESAQRPF